MAVKEEEEPEARIDWRDTWARIKEKEAGTRYEQGEDMR